MIYKEGLILKYSNQSNEQKPKMQVLKPKNNDVFERLVIPVSLNYLNNYFDCISTILRKKCIIKLKKISVNNDANTINNKTKISSDFSDESESNNDNKPQCTLCKKFFKDKYTLKKHAMVHSNKRPYKCSKCSMAFKKKYTLVQHTRIHSGEKPFSCSKCNRKFHRKAYLEAHQLNYHCLENFVECEICKKKLSSFTIKRHIRTVHEGIKHWCSICGKSLTRRHDLKRHMERIHLVKEIIQNK